MKCDLIKENLIDYIDVSLTEGETQNIKRHLDNCSDCKKEYDELKQAILYLEQSGEEIETDKDINFNPKKSIQTKKRGFKRTLLIASIVTIFISFTAFGAEIISYLDFWKEASVERTMAWDESIDNGLGQKLHISVEDNGIRVTAEGVIADELNTLILLKVEDLNGDDKFGESYNDVDGIDIAEHLEVSGDTDQNEDSITTMNFISSLYKEEKGTIKLLIQTDPMNKEEGQINLKIREFMSIINEDGEFTPLPFENMEGVKRVKGNWDIEIEAKKLESYKYKVDKQILIDGNEIIINNITLAPTETNIEYEFKSFNQEKKYYLDNLNFSIEYKNKIYNNSKLGFSSNRFFINAIYDELHSSGVSSLETLYLEKPKSIKLVLNSYRYSTKDNKSYDLDLDNLPQELQYNDSILIVESISENEELMEITIKEDDSADREYISTHMYIDFPIIYNDDSKSSIQSHTPFYISNDSKRLERQTITMTKTYNKDGETLVLDENIKSILRPKSIIIEKQEYIKHPNKEIKIKLKD